MTQILLNAIKMCKTSNELAQIIDLTKETKVTKKSVDEAIKESQLKGFKIGKKVMLINDHDKDIGKIVKFNTSTIGFYTGDRYPIIVKFERGTFEYGPNCLTLI